MTELEEAEQTDGQGRALSAHKTTQAYAGYAKRTERGCWPQHASVMRIGWHETATSVQNEQVNPVQNERQSKV
jgi:hypothetical protein